VIDLTYSEDQIICVNNFDDFINTSFYGNKNVICFNRELKGDFSEIVSKIELVGNMMEVSEKQLNKLDLSPKGELARKTLLSDLKLLKELGALPTLNIIQNYDRDDAYPDFPTDVYSYHVDRSPIPVETILCTYYGAASDVLANSQGIQKIKIPEIRDKLKGLYSGTEEGFDSFLVEYFFDLHYQAMPYAIPTNLSNGNICRIAVDHPNSDVPPCLHRAPFEKNGIKRLLLIC